MLSAELLFVGCLLCFLFWAWVVNLIALDCVVWVYLVDLTCESVVLIAL